jgi:hypothetical protein
LDYRASPSLAFLAEACVEQEKDSVGVDGLSRNLFLSVASGWLIDWLRNWSTIAVWRTARSLRQTGVQHWTAELMCPPWKEGMRLEEPELAGQHLGSGVMHNNQPSAAEDLVCYVLDHEDCGGSMDHCWM